MNPRSDDVPKILARLGSQDALATMIEDLLTVPVPAVVRRRLVVEMVAHLHDKLTDSLASDREAYDAFVRTVRILNIFLPDGRRR
jgi:hypothetical protein